MIIKNKIALITGGTSGIGLATAKLFQTEGAQVVVTGTNPDRLEATQRELGADALVLQADVRQPAEIGRVIETIRDRFGHLDILFANAGKGIAAPLDSVTEEQ